MHHTTYRRLTVEEREEVSRGLAVGQSLSYISQRLSRSVSSIAREVAKNSSKTGYRAYSAERSSARSASNRRKGKSRIECHEALKAYILSRLKKRWSPQEIVKRLAVEYPADTAMRISHESIYRFIYVLPRGELKKELTQALRQEHSYRRKQKKASSPDEKRGKISDMLSIEERPKEVETRSVPGHWEGDLILGKYKKTALGTLVERTTRYVILVPLKKKDAVSVRKALSREFKKLPKEIVKTLTYDQGKEMSEHKKFTISTGITVYFAHPGSPWERGTNENTNGLLRQYFPKGTEFDKVTTKEIKRVQRELNDRPRAVLHYLKPNEMIQHIVALNV